MLQELDSEDDNGAWVRELMEEIGRTGPGLGEDQFQRTLRHVAEGGLMLRLERARAQIAGVSCQGRIVKSTDVLLPPESHYLKHVVLQREWPVSTSLCGFLDGI